MVGVRGALIAGALGVAFAAPAGAQVRGVSDGEIVLGSLQDLSGPIAQYGKNGRNGLQMRIDEINERGGIHGRKLRLVVEDSGYDPRKAVLGAQKLVENDRVFAVVANLGTPVMMASMPIFLDSKVLHLFPLSSGRQAYDPLHPLKYAFNTSYFDQAKVAVRAFEAKRTDRKWCVLYQDDDFGADNMAGLEVAMKEANKSFVEKTSYKRGATDFSSQIARLKSAGCDTVYLATVIRETIGAMAEAKKIGFSPEFVTSAAAYSDLIHKLGGAPVEGLYAAHTMAQPYPDDPSPQVREWFQRYKAKFGGDPDAFSAYGYSIIGWTAAALEKAGRNLTTESFAAAMDAATFTNDMFGFDDFTFSPTKHLGSDRSRLSQIKDGRWVVISEYIKPN